MKHKYVISLIIFWPLCLFSMPAHAWVYGSSIAVDPVGSVHIASFNGDLSALQYTTNASGSWVTEVVDAEGSVGWYPSIALDSSGKVHIAYYDNSNHYIKYATNASGSWVMTTIDVGYDPSIAVDSMDKLHISYGSGGVLMYASDASGSWVAEEVDPGPHVGAFTSIALDSSELVHISHFFEYVNYDYERTEYTLKYATNSSGAWARTTIGYVGSVDFTNYYRGDTSIGLDGSDKVHITCQGDGYLRYATNASASWLMTSLDSVGYLVGAPSIALDSLDKAHISYSSGLEGLKYITNASGSWAITPIAPCNYDTSTSLTLDGLDRVHISYDQQYGLAYATNASGMWVATAIPPPCIDIDGDGFGSPASPACLHPEEDCDDSNPLVNPGMTEDCTNGIDDNCDGLVDAADPTCQPLAWSAAPPAQASVAGSANIRGWIKFNCLAFFFFPLSIVLALRLFRRRGT